MTDTKDIVDRYLAIWNEGDAARRKGRSDTPVIGAISTRPGTATSPICKVLWLIAALIQDFHADGQRRLTPSQAKTRHGAFLRCSAPVSR